jgi:alkylated DNA repair protein alkB family protein 1
LIPRYLTPEHQLELLESALARYTLPPNPLSIDTHYKVPPNLFEHYASSSPSKIEPLYKTRRRPEKSRSTGARQTIETEPASVLGFEEIVFRNVTWQGDEPSDKLGARTAEQLMREIRWAR